MNTSSRALPVSHPKTRGREIALQYLYMHDVLEGKEVQPCSDFLGSQAPPPDAESAAFARELIQAVLEHRDELDAEISQAAKNWKLARMAIVDRNILRLGLAELLTCPATPFKVVLNESVELAKRFSSDAASAFVNGLLDKLRAKHLPETEPQTPPAPETPETETPAPPVPAAPETGA